MILKRIKNKVIKILGIKAAEAPLPVLPPPNHKEAELIHKLRQRINSLSPIVFEQNGNSTSHKWQRRLNQMRKNFLEKDPRNFTRWPDVAVTMYTNAPALELMHLQNQPTWSTWEKGIVENPTGNPIPYPAYPTSGGNLVHHAYHLSQITDRYKLSIENMRYVFEFGGGYGSMARLFYQVGFKGTYIIFDLPEFSALQEYFLSSLSLPLKITNTVSQEMNSVVLLSNMTDLRKQLQNISPDLFIATWSTSESPIDLRKEIENLARSSKYQLLGYQNHFGGVDNLSYYKDMQRKEKKFTWTDYEIEHLKENHYLLGKKK